MLTEQIDGGGCQIHLCECGVSFVFFRIHIRILGLNRVGEILQENLDYQEGDGKIRPPENRDHDRKKEGNDQSFTVRPDILYQSRKTVHRIHSSL